MKKVRLPAETTDLAELLRNLSTEPFQRELKKALEVAPSREVLRRFASKKPNEWAVIVKTLATLAGYNEKTIVQHEGILGHIHAMSDAELMQRARALAQKDEKVIDISPEL